MSLHRSSNYKNLSYLIGRELKYNGGLHLFCPPDGSVKIIADYKNTVLVELEWRYSVWYGFNMKPRKLKFMIPKASLAVGAVSLSVKDSGEPLTLNVISDLVEDMDCTI